ncbi:MAG: hypothetical protein OXG79_12925 [Chloroflexi bacterium]|nr:hypothetical protein [Chloroflexota bacterium]
MLLIPAAAFAQSDAADRLVELIFSEDDSEVSITENIQSTARVTFTHDGQDYIMSVPVDIAIDETIPIADSVSATSAAARVGVYAIEVTAVEETTEEIEVGYSSVEPSSDDNKLVGVSFNLTNLSDSAQEFSDIFDNEKVFGIDDLGRRFEMAKLLGCDEVNPGGMVECIAAFDVEESVTITEIEVHAMDERVITLPGEDEESDEDDEEEES